MSASIDMKQILERLKLKRERDMRIILKESERFAAVLVGHAQERAPVDTGALQASGTWEKPQISEDNILITIGFNTNYAAIVHETWHEGGKYSKNKNPLAEAKFLEVTLRTEGPGFAPYVARKLREVNP